MCGTPVNHQLMLSLILCKYFWTKVADIISDKPVMTTLKSVNIVIFIMHFFIKSHVIKIVINTPNNVIIIKFPAKMFLIINISISLKAVILIKELIE